MTTFCLRLRSDGCACEGCMFWKEGYPNGARYIKLDIASSIARYKGTCKQFKDYVLTL